MLYQFDNSSLAPYTGAVGTVQVLSSPVMTGPFLRITPATNAQAYAYKTFTEQDRQDVLGNGQFWFQGLIRIPAFPNTSTFFDVWALRSSTLASSPVAYLRFSKSGSQWLLRLSIRQGTSYLSIQTAAQDPSYWANVMAVSVGLYVQNDNVNGLGRLIFGVPGQPASYDVSTTQSLTNASLMASISRFDVGLSNALASSVTLDWDEVSASQSSLTVYGMGAQGAGGVDLSGVPPVNVSGRTYNRRRLARRHRGRHPKRR